MLPAKPNQLLCRTPIQKNASIGESERFVLNRTFHFRNRFVSIHLLWTLKRLLGQSNDSNRKTNIHRATKSPTDSDCSLGFRFTQVVLGLFHSENIIEHFLHLLSRSLVCLLIVSQWHFKFFSPMRWLLGCETMNSPSRFTKLHSTLTLSISDSKLSICSRGYKSVNVCPLVENGDFPVETTFFHGFYSSETSVETGNCI